EIELSLIDFDVFGVIRSVSFADLAAASIVDSSVPDSKTAPTGPSWTCQPRTNNERLPPKH
ncbi:MAG TPA: hypothetical protein VGF84_20720, partial [Micromonosporaceae bacterium]